MLVLLLACTGASVPPSDTPTSHPTTTPDTPATPAPPAAPFPDAEGMPRALYQMVNLDGAWRRPPDPGTLPELAIELDGSSPVLIRRSGAGEARWTVKQVRKVDGGWTLDLQDGAMSTTVRIAPWPAAEPKNAWKVTFGTDGSGADVAWVTTLPG